MTKEKSSHVTLLLYIYYRDVHCHCCQSCASCVADLPMAELDIGQHCSYAACQQLDFLPFTCDKCLKVFCKEHRSLDSHSCTECNVLVKPSGGGTASAGPLSYECSLPACTNRELLDIVCDACKKRFCLHHRHAGDHMCDCIRPNADRMVRTAQHVENILKSKAESAARKPRGRKSKATADKVTLMKLKMGAIGDKHAPEVDRVYFRVILPMGNTDKSKALFFNKTWTVGRVIDKCATLLGIQNDNNVSAAKKLKLFDFDDGCVLPTDVALENLIQGEGSKLNNGCAVILEYVADGTTTLDDQLQSYQIK